MGSLSWFRFVAQKQKIFKRFCAKNGTTTAGGPARTILRSNFCEMAALHHHYQSRMVYMLIRASPSAIILKTWWQQNAFRDAIRRSYPLWVGASADPITMCCHQRQLQQLGQTHMYFYTRTKLKVGITLFQSFWFCLSHLGLINC